MSKPRFSDSEVNNSKACRSSAATRRLRVVDSENELYTRFRYSPVTGLGYAAGVGRRDPSSTIKVGDLYYIGYTHCTEPER